MDAIEALIDNVVHTCIDDIPPRAIEGARKSILDAFATTIAGSSAPGVADVLALLEQWGGRTEATVALLGHKLPAYHAVMANVLMCHALEIDDSHYPAIVHPTAPTLWAALATCEQIKEVRGEEFLCAVVLGIDSMARIALSAPATLDNGYHTAIYSGFGAAVTAAKLQRVSKEILHNALGIVFARAAASVQAGSDGALVKRMQPAFNASEAIKAVQFASRGVTGIKNILEGQFGIATLFNHGPLNKEPLLDGLGKRFLASELSTKRYPTSRCAHGPIEATLSLIRQHNIAASDVLEVTVSVQESCYKRESKSFDPHDGTPQVKAQFSIDYCVAAAILWRDVFIREMQLEQIMDPAVLSLTRRIKVRCHSVVGNTQYLPVHVAVRTKSETVACEVTSLKGSPEDPLSWDEIVEERLERCLRYSITSLPRNNISQLIEQCRRIELMRDVTALIGLLTPSRVR
jgi:2-methylcitrate dehydratase PrpD